MARYEWVCDSCGHSFIMSKNKCPKCKGTATKTLVDGVNVNLDCMNREYEFYGSGGTRMYAAGYLPNQIEEARKIHPGTDFILHNNCYIPRIKNRVHKLKYLKEMGFIEKD